MIKKYTTHKTLKGWIRLLIKIIIVTFFVVGIFLIFSSLNISTSKKDIILSYDIEQNLTHHINLFDNEYINDNSLSTIDNYITSLVSSIDLNYNYIYEATKPGNYNYSYEINATLYGEYTRNEDNNDSRVWVEEYNLLPMTERKATQANSFSINETVNLNFLDYNAKVINFKNTFNIPINAYLEVVMAIKVNGTAESNNIVDNESQKFVIPLNQLSFSVETDAKENEHQEIVSEEEKKSNNMLRFDIGIICIVYSFMMLILTFKYVFKTKGKSKFDIELNRILKSYGDVIVELLTPISLENKDIVFVKSFNEMLDLEEELRTPINFIKVSKDKGEFLILHHEICYKWVLDDVD